MCMLPHFRRWSMKHATVRNKGWLHIVLSASHVPKRHSKVTDDEDVRSISHRTNPGLGMCTLQVVSHELRAKYVYFSFCMNCWWETCPLDSSCMNPGWGTCTCVLHAAWMETGRCGRLIHFVRMESEKPELFHVAGLQSVRQLHRTHHSSCMNQRGKIQNMYMIIAAGTKSAVERRMGPQEDRS